MTFISTIIITIIIRITVIVVFILDGLPECDQKAFDHLQPCFRCQLNQAYQEGENAGAQPNTTQEDDKDQEKDIDNDSYHYIHSHTSRYEDGDKEAKYQEKGPLIPDRSAQKAFYATIITALMDEEEYQP